MVMNVVVIKFVSGWAHLARVAGERAEEAAVTVHYNEAEFIVRLEQLLQGPRSHR